MHRNADPNETTEWEDILVKKGIISERPEIIAAREAEAGAEAKAEAAAEAAAGADKFAGKTVDELGDLLDEDDEFADDRALELYRQQRLEEMKAKQKAKRFGFVHDIKRVDFTREMNEGSMDKWVVLHLHQAHVENCALMDAALKVVAERHEAVRFLRIVATECIENYPDKNLPTLIIYHRGECQLQIVGLAAFGGQGFTADDVEWKLANIGALETELEEDPRATRQAQSRERLRAQQREGHVVVGGGRGGGSAGGGAGGGSSSSPGGGSAARRRRRFGEEEDDDY